MAAGVYPLDISALTLKVRHPCPLSGARIVEPIVRSVERSTMLLLDGPTSMIALLPFGMPGWAETQGFTVFWNVS